MSDPVRGNVTVTLSCPKCGSNKLTIPDKASDDSPVICSSCGAEIGRWGDAKTAANKAAAEKVKEAVTDMLGKALDGQKGITFKKTK